VKEVKMDVACCMCVRFMKILVSETQWTEQFRGPIQRMDLATMVGGRMDWINLFQNGDQW
jgi:hypothetical protein